MTNDLNAALQVMKKCQRGFPRHMIDDSNNLHAECYGIIGSLVMEVETLRKLHQPDRRQSKAMKTAVEPG